MNIFVSGGNGFLGRHVMSLLSRNSDYALETHSSHECDLRIRKNCEKVVKGKDIVIHLAGNVGGIGYNQQYPGTLFYDNLIMGVELMEAARKAGVKKFVTVGTVCAYPKNTSVPFKEEDLWNGYPEETNAPYGIAKKALLVQGQAYRKQYGFNAIYLLPINLYGPGDNFDDDKSHVVPALIKKFLKAKELKEEDVVVWGTGKPTRGFLYVKDAARGIVNAMEKYNGSEPINLGSDQEISIHDLAFLIKDLVGFRGEVIFDSSKPDGQPRRNLDTSKADKLFRFEAKTDFKEGLKETIEWYEAQRVQEVNKWYTFREGGDIKK